MLTVCSLLLLLQTPQPAPPAAEDPQLQELIRKLQTVHGGGSPPAVDAYEAEIELKPLTSEQDSHAVRFQVKYLRAQRLLRYGTVEQGRKIERGRDRVGPWTRGEGPPISLNEAERAQERQEFLQHLRLAERLARYLDPAALVSELTDTKAIRSEDLRFAADRKLACKVVEGKHASLPLYYQAAPAGDPAVRRTPQEGPVQLKLWIAEETGRLVFMRATPLTDEGKPTGLHESVWLGTWTEREGVLLPTSMVFSATDDANQPLQPIEVTVHKLLLNPALAAEEFDRNR